MNQDTGQEKCCVALGLLGCLSHCEFSFSPSSACFRVDAESALYRSKAEALHPLLQDCAQTSWESLVHRRLRCAVAHPQVLQYRGQLLLEENAQAPRGREPELVDDAILGGQGPLQTSCQRREAIAPSDIDVRALYGTLKPGMREPAVVVMREVV